MIVNTIPRLENENDDDNAPIDENDTLGSQVLNYISKQVKSSTNKGDYLTIRPAKLATHLGISIDEAERELCGLLSATQRGSFEFEKQASIEHANNNNAVSMVFQLPKDIVSRARSVRRREGCWDVLYGLLHSLLAALRVLAGIGILLSIAIVTIAAVIVVVAALVAMMTGNNNNNNSSGGHRMRTTFFRMREFLWLYAMFGSDNTNPFFRDMAWNMSLCYGSPFSPMFWMRMMLMSSRRRRGRYGRSWSAANNRRSSSSLSSNESNALVRRGVWGRNVDDNDDDNNSGTGTIRRSTSTSSTTTVAGEQQLALSDVLSIIDEFLFGPSSSSPGPTTTNKWRLRAAAILNHSEGSVTLEQLLPYVDDPPASISSNGSSLASLSIVSHFRGVPVVATDRGGGESSADSSKAGKSQFRFAELLMEGTEIESSILNKDIDLSSIERDNANAGACVPLLYKDPDRSDRYVRQGDVVPSCLIEGQYVLTNMTRSHFMGCVGLALGNYFGVVWIREYFSADGDTAFSLSYPAILTILQYLFSVLALYAKFFLMLPLLRLFFIMLVNVGIDRRNMRRKTLARELEAVKV